MTSSSWIFEVFPYIAIFACVTGTFIRYKYRSYSISSLSSQFLESKQLFWGSVPWHYGILFALLVHFLAFAFPNIIATLASGKLGFLPLEILSVAFGILAVFGILVFFYRRMSNSRVWAVTTKVDLLILVLLLGQGFSGILIASTYRWGAGWFAGLLSPYLWSILKFQPDSSFVNALPILVRAHIFGAFLLTALLPYSRLIHALFIPIAYLWREPQVVIWNRRNE